MMEHRPITEWDEVIQLAGRVEWQITDPITAIQNIDDIVCVLETMVGSKHAFK